MTYATSPEDLMSYHDMLSMSGLEFMQGILSGKYPAPPIGKTLGFELISVEDGRVVFQGTPEFDVLNPMGTVHGGWYGAILDSALGCAVMTKVPQGSLYTTLEYKVNILKSIPMGMTVQARAETEHVGRSTGVAHGRLVGVEDGRTYATASTTCILMTP